jgi:arylsulfatase A-like enzyme
MTDRPNIVLIFSDQHRADAMGCAGSAFVETPHLDRLAAEGTRFDQAFTPWPVCTPARASMWTGAYPHAHGIIDNVYGIDNAFEIVGRVRTTVFDRLREAGYLTAHFGKWHLGEAQPPFFDIWEESFNSRVGHWVDGKLDGTYRPDVQTDASIAFLRRQAGADQPFVMVQSYYPPHDPYTAPARFYAPYRHRGVPFAGYYAAVSALDWNIGRIMRTLDDTGLRRSTLVIYYSDHGDTFFYRPEGEHKFVCTDDAIRIPFIASMPGTVMAGAVSRAPVGLQDLAPTMLDFAGAPAAPTHGTSLRPLFEGRLVPDWRQGYYVQNTTHVSGIVQRAWRTEGWKLVASADGSHALYNLAADPEEELDVFRTPRDDPGFERFTHYPSHAPLIRQMCDAALAEADAIDDDEGRALFAAARDAAA